MELSKDTKWITRVPEGIKAAKQLIAEQSMKEMTCYEKGYKYSEHKIEYADVEQRWLLVYSESAYKRESATLDRAIEKVLTKKQVELNKLLSIEYACENDAHKVLEKFEKALKYHKLGEIELIPRNVREEPKDVLKKTKK